MGTDSMSSAQPFLTAKYTVFPSGDTDTSSPIASWFGVMAVPVPVAESSTSTAPPVVTATIPGRVDPGAAPEPPPLGVGVPPPAAAVPDPLPG
jgi:hypothetical protein